VLRWPSAVLHSLVGYIILFNPLMKIYCYHIEVMVDFPTTAKFLTPEERDYVIWVKSKDLFRESKFVPLISCFFRV
jgi:hypothetical protein